MTEGEHQKTAEEEPEDEPWIERRLKRRVPWFIGWELLALSVAGLLVMPVSGFWLVLAVAIYTIVMASRSRLASDAVA